MAIEYISLSLNPRMTLYSRKSLYSCIQANQNHELLAEFEEALNTFEWALYDVRRLLYSKRVVHRKVEGLAKGTRREMAELLAEHSDKSGIPLSHEAGMPRLHLVPRQPGVYPSAEQMLVTAPAFPVDKSRKTFEKSWQKIFPAAAPLIQLESAA